MKVINRNYQRDVGNGNAKRAKQRERDRCLIWNAVFGVPQNQRDLERTPLRRGKLVQGALEHGVEQICETRVRNLTLRLRGPR